MQQHSSKYFVDISPPQDPGVGQKGQNQLFQNMVMLHIKLDGITNGGAW